MALMVALLSGGCQDVSVRQVSGMVLSCSIGFIILSWPVVILLTLLGRRLNLVRNRAVLLQYGVYVLIQIIISLSLGLLRADFGVSIVIIVFIQLQSIPYLLLVGGLLILVLPVRLLAWVPSFLLVPHYLMFGLLYVTKPKWPQMDVTTFFLMSLLWHVAILFGVVTLVVLLIRRKMKNGGRKEKKANRKAQPVDGRS
jgi:hypothetical protein